jgi:hypothetical protein
VAMNKKEKAELERWKTRAALSWSVAVEPDVMPPTDHSYRDGFLPVASGSDRPRVDFVRTWSRLHTSALSEDYKFVRTRSQGARELYSSRLLALKALRHQVEEECAKRLRRIDAQIENEEARAASGPEDAA